MGSRSRKGFGVTQLFFRLESGGGVVFGLEAGHLTSRSRAFGVKKGLWSIHFKRESLSASKEDYWCTVIKVFGL